MYFTWCYTEIPEQTQWAVFYIDVLKAFDGCIHKKLWSCLLRHGVRRNFLGIFDTMYRQLKSGVRVDGGLTDFFQCSTGTLQSCISSPIIFSLFINDLVTYLRHKCGSGIYINNDINDLYKLVFAGDVSSVADSVLNLQQQINYIDDFCKDSGLNLNLDNP